MQRLDASESGGGCSLAECFSCGHKELYKAKHVQYAEYSLSVIVNRLYPSEYRTRTSIMIFLTISLILDCRDDSCGRPLTLYMRRLPVHEMSKRSGSGDPSSSSDLRVVTRRCIFRHHAKLPLPQHCIT